MSLSLDDEGNHPRQDLDHQQQRTDTKDSHQRLHAARRDRLTALGEAILRGDRAHSAQLKAETRKLGEEMHARDHEASAAISSAREQIERERIATQATATHAGDSSTCTRRDRLWPSPPHSLNRREQWHLHLTVVGGEFSR